MRGEGEPATMLVFPGAATSRQGAGARRKGDQRKSGAEESNLSSAPGGSRHPASATRTEAGGADWMTATSRGGSRRGATGSSD